VHQPQADARANEALIRAFYAARASNGPLDGFITDDVVWEVPGSSRIAGTYKGPSELRAYIALRDELSAGTFRIDVHHVIARARAALLLSTSHAARNGTVLDSPGAAIFELRDGLIARCRLLPSDQSAFDAFWS
jgi:ketosteroid isomerase-like protein